MKEGAKRLLRSIAVRLPWGARVTILEALSTRHGADYDLLVRQASRANIAAFMVNGTLGLIQSAISDRMILPIYARTGNWAERANAEMTRFFDGGFGTYLDVGANIGLTTISVARNPQVQCIAFEPDPTNFRNLRDNLVRNASLGNVISHQVALFHHEAEVQFSLANDGNLGDHRIVKKASAGRRTINVKAMPLDAMVQNISGPLAAKIDVQGAEPGVIAGGSRVLRKAEFVILEFAPFLMAQLGGDYRIVIDFLRGFSQIAAVPGEFTGPLVYRSSQDVCAELEDFYQNAVSDERQFMDLYARR